MPMKMEQTECSETSAYELQTSGNYPKENIQQVVGLFPGGKAVGAWRSPLNLAPQLEWVDLYLYPPSTPSRRVQR